MTASVAVRTSRGSTATRSRALQVWRPVAILVAARASQLVVLAVARASHPGLSLLGSTQWDSAWYQAAAQHGWPHAIPDGASTLAFFPGFPVAIRVVHAVLPLSWTHATLATAALTQVTMVLAFWMLARDIWDNAVADRSTLLLCFLPGAFILSLGYSEPLFLTFACLSLLALRRERWVAAGLLSALATTARIDGLALIACCAWASWMAIRKSRQWRSIVAVVLAPLGIVAWFAYLKATTGSWTVWFHAEKVGWAERFTLSAPSTLVHDFVRYGFTYPNYWVTFFSSLVALVLLLMVIRVKPPAILTIFTVIVLALALFSIPLGLRPRFVMTAFPLCMAAGVLLRRWLLWGTLVCGAVAVGYVLTLTVTGTTLVP